MTTAQIKKELLKRTEGLPNEALLEILNFIKFIKFKTSSQSAKTLNEELSNLDSSQATHLEEEFADYKRHYPHE